MAKLTINNYLTVNGNMSVTRTLVNEETGEMQITGILKTHLYFDEIKEISTDRYKLKGVQVFREDYGSDDYNIIYSFKADDLDILGIESKGVTFILSPKEMKKIEEVMYKDDIPIVGSIGTEYKDLIDIGDDNE